MEWRGWASVPVCAAVIAFAVGMGKAVDARGKDDEASRSESAIRDTRDDDAAPQQTVPFEKSPAWQKVDPGLQASWKDAMASGDTDRRFDAFVRCRETIDQGDQSFLISNGFVIRAASGQIASGHLKAGDLPSVAALPFVQSVKLSTKP